MGLKHTIPALAVLLCLGIIPWSGLQAEPRGGDDDARDRGSRERELRNPQIIIRSDADKQRRDKIKASTADSNRQSDPDSTRGLERAEERRPDHADADSNTEDGGWYEYFFGKRQTAETKTERGWYEYVFGDPAVANPDKEKDSPKEENKDEDENSSWWWPFD